MLVIKFRIGGALRFISHAQTLNVFQRACVRAGMEIQYSQGFNPRPRLSLPLPRPVGIASDDEMLCVRVYKSEGLQTSEYMTKQVYKNMGAQLPQGLELISVSIVDSKTSYQPCSAKYRIAVGKEYLNEELKETIKCVLKSDSIKIQRQTGKTKSRIRNHEPKIKNIDVRDFLESIDLNPEGIIAEFKITPAGSIRMEEFLKLLDLSTEKLILPVRRVSVRWKSN